MEAEYAMPGAQPAVTTANLSVVNSDLVAETVVIEWSVAKRIAFRLAFIYFVFYAMPFPLGYIPLTDTVSSYYSKIWEAVVPWLAQHVLHLGYQIGVADTGSGDRTYDWILTGTYLTLAIVGTIVWSLIDRRRANYERLYRWLRLYVRLYVGAVLIGYGAYKVIQSQFPAPNLARLVQPYGDSSPMGLLWTFMGSSYLYNLFTGGAEIVGGAFLIIPPLATLGALLTIACMGNVFILNMAYDVPVKLFSFNLVVMAAFVALPDTERLLNLFVLNRPTTAAPARPLFVRPRLNDAIRWLQLILLAVFLGLSLYQSWQGTKFFATIAVPEPIKGVWTVNEFVEDGKPQALTPGDSNRWFRIVLDHSNRISVEFVDAPLQRYGMELDESTHTLNLVAPNDPNWKSELKYETPKPDTLVLNGTINGHPVSMTAHRKPLSDFRLLNRGFHWVSEAPFNR